MDSPLNPTANTGLRTVARLLLLSTAALSASAAAARLLAVSGAPRAAYAAAVTWLRPPYLYFVLNGIILTIAASSRFQKGDSDVVDPKEEVEANAPVGPAMREEEVAAICDAATEDGVDPAEIAREIVDRMEKVEDKKAEAEVKIGRTGSGEFPDAPTASARFAGKRSAKAHNPGNQLRVARPRRSETLESTWKMITDGRSVPLSRHLKKSDTWETRGVRPRKPLLTPEAPSRDRPAARTLRREPSLGQEELNRRVEAFISKFNKDTRLQREESLKRYWATIKGR